MKQALQKIHLTYKILGKPAYLDEYQRAISAALTGDDPTLLMCPAAAKVYSQIRKELTARTLDPDGRNLHGEMCDLSAALKSTKNEVSNVDLISVCDLVVASALYYKKPRTTVEDRMILARTAVEMLLLLVRAVDKYDAELSTVNAQAYVDSIRANTQAINVRDTDSEEFEGAVDNVIYLRDYIESKSGEVL